MLTSTPEQDEKLLRAYAAFGQFTIAFNMIDGILKHELCYLIGASERAVAIAFTNKANTTHHKIALVRLLLTEIEKDRPTLKDQIAAVRDALLKLDALKKERNDHVHAIAVISNVTADGPGELRLHTGTRLLKLDEGELRKLLEQAWAVTHAVQYSLFTLKVALDRLRHPGGRGSRREVRMI